MIKKIEVETSWNSFPLFNFCSCFPFQYPWTPVGVANVTVDDKDQGTAGSTQMSIEVRHLVTPRVTHDALRCKQEGFREVFRWWWMSYEEFGEINFWVFDILLFNN